MTITIPNDIEPVRLDLFLREHTDFSRSRAAGLIREGKVHVNERMASKPSELVLPGDILTVEVAEAEDVGIVPQNLPIDILYQDGDIAVMNKACGMVVHPAAGNYEGTLVNAIMYHIRDLSGIGGEMRPGIVHRLDKDTSGAIVIAKNDMAHLSLSDQFKNRTMEKHYRVVVLGHMKEEKGRIEAPIDRDKNNRKKMAVSQDGRPAITEWSVLASLNGADYLDVHLLTGRTHQIRVHMKSIGHPVLGDVIYASNIQTAVRIPRLMLHSYSLELDHPRTKERMLFTAPLPEAFVTTLRKLGWDENAVKDESFSEMP